MTLTGESSSANILSTLPASLDKNVILRAEHITKVFPGTLALDRVTFNVYEGKVNVLVGENGAGKSTLMKILAGAEQPTHGRILLNGKEIRLRTPLDATRYGIGIIYQELNLCPNLSVMDNIFLAREMRARGTIDKKTEREIVLQLMKRLEHSIDPNAMVSDLRIGQQQIVEIAKALTQDVRVLIMDEPTSALSAAEVDVLFRVIRELKSQGVSIVYISHKLEELLQIGDYITVLRDGRVVAHEPIVGINVPWIIERMVGRNLSSVFSREEHQSGGQVLLRVEDLTLPRHGGGYLLDHVSFELRAGEVLGFYGLMGAGRSDMADCLAGRRPEAQGRIYLNGTELKGNSVSERLAAGIVLVPEDRQRDGLVPTLSVAHNMLLASLRKYLNKFFLERKKEESAVRGLIRDLSIRVADPAQPITSLSGGNQQKVVFAKGLLTDPKVLILDEPTRGIDVGAKSEIFEIVNRLARQGFGIIFISSELKEIMAISDRIIVMSKGAITGEYCREDATEEKLVADSFVGHVVNNHKNGSNYNKNKRED